VIGEKYLVGIDVKVKDNDELIQEAGAGEGGGRGRPCRHPMGRRFFLKKKKKNCSIKW
jgi:hypothetical protein